MTLETAHDKQIELPKSSRYFMDLLLLSPNMEDYDGTKQCCHHLQVTSTNCGEKQHSNVTFNLDTTSILTITALALRKVILLYQKS